MLADKSGAEKFNTAFLPVSVYVDMHLSIINMTIIRQRRRDLLLKPHVNRYQEINKRRQGHLRFTTEPKQSTKGRRRLPGNTIPITAGSRVAQNINHFRLRLTKVTALQSRGHTAVLHHFQSLQFITEFTGIYALNPRETRPLDCSRCVCASNENTFPRIF